MALPTSWYNLANTRFAPGDGFIADFFLDAKLNWQNAESNQSSVSFRLRMEVQAGSGSTTSSSYGINLGNGDIVSGGGALTYGNIILIGEQARIINHDGSGNAWASASAWFWGARYGGDINKELSGSIDLPQIDRNGITISNYTLRDCSDKKLYINFSFNYDARNTWYRYRKSASSSWETDWIEWQTYGGYYNTNTRTGYFITPKLKPGTNYVIETRVQRNYNGVYTSKSATFYVESSIFLKRNSSWVDGEVYIKKNGVWKKGTTVYIKKNGTWKEAG